MAREGAPLCVPIDLRLEAGQLLLIRGRNGSGKSTLLKTLAGLLPVHEGRAILAETGDEGNAQSPWEILPKPLYLGHKRALSLSMNVMDNVAFWARAAGYPELIDAALHYWDLEDIPDAPVSSLSAGWQQRVALTRLITMPTGLWLLDEPTSNLDGEGVELLHSLIQTRLEQGGLVLAASHITFEGERVKEYEINGLLEKPQVNVA